MPLVRIAVPTTMSEATIATVSDVVYEAMVATLDVPSDDRFQLFSTPSRVYDRTFPSIARSADTIFIDVTMRRGRTPEKKRAFYAAVAAGLASRAGMKAADVFVVLHENEPIDWSFGDGVAQYAPG
jgi:4-oxalocrotonate tautomerase